MTGFGTTGGDATGIGTAGGDGAGTKTADERVERSEARTDRRVRRTQHALLHALMELVVERGYDQVTVQDIIDRADVGRSTFYAHYRDKEALLLSGFDEELRQTFGSSAPVPERGDAPVEAPSLRLFRHAARHGDLFRVLSRRRGAWPLVRRQMEATLADVFAQRLREAPSQPDLPLEAVARCLASTLVGLLSWWLDDGMRIETAVMDRTFRALVTDGTRAVLGVEF